LISHAHVSCQDFHPDEHYQPSTSEDKSCHRGKGDAGIYGAEVSSCDSPFFLADATLDWVAANLKDEVDFVIWTGDSARHDNDETIPRTGPEVLRNNQYLVSRMKDVFSDDERPSQLAVPIVPNIGNNDFLPHNILLPGPNRWLDYYADMWRTFIPEEQRHTFQFGGWYSVEVVPDQLVVFSLNTMYFFDRNAGIDDCTTPSEPGYHQMEWLRVQLQRLRERGVKAILSGHVPPVKTASKELWDETCWQKYNLWLRQYRDVIVGSVYGHMNIDHFYLHDTRDIDIRSLGGTDDDLRGIEDYEHHDESSAWADDEDPVDDDGEVDLMDEVSTQANGKSRYLLELRRAWAKLPEVTILCGASDNPTTGPSISGGKKKGKKGGKGKGKKKKKGGSEKLGGKWAERYHLSLVSPSVVPNFFPSIRVIQYNITGLEDAPTWDPAADTADISMPTTMEDVDVDELEAEIQQAEAVKSAKKSKKGRKGRKKKDKNKGRPKDPNLVVPDPPAKTSSPGPAYAPQPLTWTGYTQYFANLSQINQAAAGDDADGPRAKGIFEFEVEYDTWSDKLYKLKDLTVRNYVRLAYRAGLAASKKGKGKAASWQVLSNEGVDEQSDNSLDEVDESDESVEDDDFETEAFECEVSGSGKNEKRRRASEKVWRRFLRYAFVNTGFEESADGLRHEKAPEERDELGEL
jgi:endopolyphosphatase